MIWGGNLNLSIDLSLLDLYGSIEQADLGIGDRLRHVGVQSLLIDYYSTYQLRVGYAAADLLLYGDIIGIDGPVFVNHGLNCLNSYHCQFISGRLRALAGHSGDGDLPKQLIIFRGDLYRHGFQNLYGLVCSISIT